MRGITPMRLRFDNFNRSIPVATGGSTKCTVGVIKGADKEGNIYSSFDSILHIFALGSALGLV